MLKASESADEVLEILQSFGIMDLDSDTILSMKQGRVSDFNSSVSSLPQITKESIERVNRITHIIREWRRRNTQSDFWSALRDNGIAPDRLELLCLYVLQFGDNFVDDAVSLFLTLLSTEVALSVWNPLIFQPVLSILLSIAQMYEEGSQVGAETKKKLKTSVLIMENIQHLMSASFINTIGIDAYVALAEVTTKLASGFRPDVTYDSYNTKIQNSAFEILQVMVDEKCDVILQFLVPWGLLLFAQSTAQMTARLEKLSSHITDFLVKNIKKFGDYEETFIRHLMVRAPERSHLKKNAASLVFALIKTSNHKKSLMNFLKKLGMSSRAGNRAFASLVIAMCVVKSDELQDEKEDDDENEEEENKTDKSEELINDFITIIKKHIIDRSPTVRSAGLDGFSIIIKSLKNHSHKVQIRQLIDSNKYLTDTLKLRLADEKLVVRKAALNCTKEILAATQTDPSEALIDLVIERLRDFAVSMRIAAIRVISDVMEQFPRNEYVHQKWLDSILPLIEDKEQSVQKEAMAEMNEHLFTPIISGAHEMFTKIMDKEHYDFLGRIFNVLKISGYDLSPLSRALTKFVINREESSNTPYWRMIEILTKEEKHRSLFRDKGKLFADLWYRRETLPPEYYGALANLGVKRDEILSDIQNDLKEAISKGSLYLLTHEILELYKIQHANTEEGAVELIEYCLNIVNKASEDQDMTFDDPKAFAHTVFILGELFRQVNDTKILTDFDLTGVQILIAEKLPNGVEIPTEVRATAVITLGKLCIMRKDIATNSVFSFAKILACDTAPEVKSNCLVVLCDLNVEYSLMVNAHIPVMTDCLADKNNAVKRQALTVITKLIVEDYIKMDSLFFFRYLHAITDHDPTIAEFAKCCLFNVIADKCSDLLTRYFVDSLIYFSECGQLLTLDETKESHMLFVMSPKRRMTAYRMIISRLREPDLWKLINDIFKRCIDKFVSNEYHVNQHSDLLQDCLLSLQMMEDKLQSTSKAEVSTDDTTRDRTLEVAKAAIAAAHKHLISTLLPSLKNLHQIVRESNSPLQKYIKKFYQQLCANDPELLSDLDRTEPILAAEIHEELNKEVQEEEEEEVPAKITKFAPLSSPLLIRISNTPISLLCSPAPSSGEQAVLRTPKRAKVVREFMTPPHQDIDLSD